MSVKRMRFPVPPGTLFGILLDSGHIHPLPRAKSKRKAREALDRLRASRRKSIADGHIVYWRQALGLVIFHREKHAGAVRLGMAGGKARAEKLSPERRSEIARKAAQKRWAAA